MTEIERHMKMIEQGNAVKTKRGWIVSFAKGKFYQAYGHQRKMFRLAWRELAFARKI